MYFEPSFFQGEEKEGFYIRPMIKRNWAAQLEVLHQVDLICKRHNITYWADWGTLLGAIRHKGFIPWDDDIDIAMKRMDYMRFISYAKKELPEDFAIKYARDAINTTNTVTQILNSKCINISSEFLEKFHGCPYATGLDIFVYDNIPLDKAEEEIQLQILESVFILEEYLVKEHLKGFLDTEKKQLYIKKIEDLCNIQFDKEKPIKEQIFLLIDNLCSMYWDIEPNEICYFLEFVQKRHLRFPNEWFSSLVEVPFENTTIPVPTKYHEILTLLYGDYMTPVQGTAGHDYPFFKNQEYALFEEFKRRGMEVPECFRE